MFTKTFILIMMLFTLGCLASGLIFLIKDEGKSKRTAKSLTWRIALSVGLFIFILLAFSFEWITPNEF